MVRHSVNYQAKNTESVDRIFSLGALEVFSYQQMDIAERDVAFGVDCRTFEVEVVRAKVLG